MKSKLLLGMFSASLLGACTDYHFSGDINMESVDRLSMIADRTNRISVSSLGGDPNYAYQFSQIIAREGLIVELGDECSSSCAEFVLPSAAKVVTHPNTLIGYHGSDWIGAWIRDTWYHNYPPNCGASRVEFLRDMYARRGLNSEAWREVVPRLKMVGQEAWIEDGCMAGSFSKWVVIWYPTSAQMRDIFGFDEIKTLCSDREECWSERIRGFGLVNKRFAVGDRYVMLNDAGDVVDVDWSAIDDEFLIP